MVALRCAATLASREHGQGHACFCLQRGLHVMQSAAQAVLSVKQAVLGVSRMQCI